VGATVWGGCVSVEAGVSVGTGAATVVEGCGAVAYWLPPQPQRIAAVSVKIRIHVVLCLFFIRNTSFLKYGTDNVQQY
jgi:hypothetical protein